MPRSSPRQGRPSCRSGSPAPSAPEYRKPDPHPRTRARTVPRRVYELGAGHTVTGLARSDTAAARLEALGATPHRGCLDELDSLRSGAENADGVLHMAYGGDYADPDDLLRRDRTAIERSGRH